MFFLIRTLHVCVTYYYYQNVLPTFFRQILCGNYSYLSRGNLKEQKNKNVKYTRSISKLTPPRKCSFIEIWYLKGISRQEFNLQFLNFYVKFCLFLQRTDTLTAFSWVVKQESNTHTRTDSSILKNSGLIKFLKRNVSRVYSCSLNEVFKLFNLNHMQHSKNHAKFLRRNTCLMLNLFEII